MILFVDSTGPLILCNQGMLTVEDLNPESKIGWRMSRMEMFKLGWRCLKTAVFVK